MKKILWLFIYSLSIVSCGNENEKESTGIKVAMLTSAGGLGDRAYNDTANKGLLQLKEMGFDTLVVEPRDVSEGERYLTDLAKSGYQLIYVLEYGHADIVERVAPLFPEVQFVVFNLIVEGDNVTSVLFDVHQSAFLAGALAAMVTTDADNPKTNPENVISAIGGVESPGINIFLIGYKEGALYVDPKIQVLLSYANTFSDPVKGKEMALAQIANGSDIIFSVSGGTGEGVFEAVKSKNNYAIGVDSDQDFIAPGNILTSVLKKMDVAVYDLGKKFSNDELKSGVIKMSLPNGTYISDMIHTKQDVKPEFMEKLKQIEQDIDSKKIIVTDATQS